MIRKFFNKIKNDKLVQDNMILFIATLFTNICSFVFHFFFGRALGPAGYGAFGAIMSLVYLMLIPLNTIQTGVAKFVTIFKVEKNKKKIAFLLKKTLAKMALYAFIVFFVFVFIVAPWLGEFLKIENSFWPMLIMGIFFFFALLLPITRGVLQGLQLFKSLGVTLFLEGFSKLLFGAFFILIGWQLNGAVLSFAVSYVVAFFFSLWLARKWLAVQEEKCSTGEIYKYSFPVLLGLISLNVFYSIDVILVKHFFEPELAGYYAAFALLSKIVFFGSISISQVMFPKSSELFCQGKDSKGLLFKSLLMVGGYGGLVTLFYYLFPGFVVGFFFGNAYINMANLNWLMALVMTFFSMVYVIVFYKLSVNQYKFLGILFLFNTMQVGLIWFYHSSLFIVMQIFLILMAILFVILMLGVVFGRNEIKHSSSCEK